MTEQEGGSGSVQWRQIMDQIGKGQAVEIPCESEQIAERRAAQAARRAVKAGVEVEVVREGNVLRLSPRVAAEAAGNNQGERQKARAERQAKRAEQRKSSRAGGKRRDR